MFWLLQLNISLGKFSIFWVSGIERHKKVVTTLCHTEKPLRGTTCCHFDQCKVVTFLILLNQIDSEILSLLDMCFGLR